MANRQKNTFYIKKIISPTNLLFLIIGFSIIPRLLKILSSEDYYTNMAVGSYLLHAKSIFFDHHLQLLGQQAQNTGFAQGAGVYYLLGIPLIMMNGDPYSAQIFMFLVSSLIIILVPLLLKRIYGLKEAIFIGILLGISPYLNYHSVSLWPPYIVPLLIAFYFIFFLWLLIKKERKYYFFMTVALEFVPHFEIASFALIIPSYLVLTIYLFVNKFIRIKDLFFSGGIFIFLFLPHIIFDFSHNFFNFKGLIEVVPIGYAKTSTFNIISNLIDRSHLIRGDLLTIFPPIPLKLMYLFLLILLFGSYKYIKDKSIANWKKIFILNLYTTITLSSLTLFLLPFTHAEVWWIPYHSIIYIFIAGIILSYIWSQKSIVFKIIILLILFIFIKVEIENIYHTVIKENNDNNRQYKIRLQAPIEYIYADSHNEPFKILYITESTYVLDFKYMFWYVGQSKYPNSEGFKELDLSYILPGGQAVPLEKYGQFKHLSRGLYYTIITQPSIESGYASRFLKIPIGQLLSIKSININYIVQKHYVR